MNTAPEAVPAAPRILVSFWVPRAKGDYFVAVNVSLKLHSKREQSKTHLFPLRLQFCRSLESDLQAQAPEQRLVMEPVPFKEVSFRGHARATPRLVSFQGFYMGVPPTPEICEFILNSRQCKNPLGKFYRRKGILCKQTSVIQKGFFGAFVLLQPRNIALLLR